ncbi:MAG: recombination protein RecR [Desulfobacteraceae bacterium]|nr:recombination protein RecR [Desulfobacteraceae bacterium]
MQYYPESVRSLIKNFGKLPGIGEKTAERLAIHVLKRPSSEAEQLANSLVTVKQKVRLCSQCFALSDCKLCHICRNSNRDSGLLCVVEQPADMISIEKSGAFNGLYHVLGGALSPVDGVGPEDIRLRELFAKVLQAGIKELVLATGTNVEGESTAAYIAKELSGCKARITRIATGVPVGGDLKYVDKMTLKSAMSSRYDIK